MTKRYWIIVASRDHGLNGKKLGIIQVNHGKQSPLKRMSAGDKVLIYSPTIIYGSKEPYQRFIALAEVSDEIIYQAEVSQDFKPFRRQAHYLDVTEIKIKPLIDKLEFISYKKNWGYSFRFGWFEINEHDFGLIRTCMLTSHG